MGRPIQDGHLTYRRALLRDSMGAAARHTTAGRVGAGYLVAVGLWLIVLPLVAGIDSDSLPVLLAVTGGPGVVLLVSGLTVLVDRPSAGG